MKTKEKGRFMLPAALFSPPGTNFLSRVLGDLVHTKPPKTMVKLSIKAYAKSLGIDLDEAERPVEQYASFAEFFTRRLKPGARPIADTAVVSPVDSLVQAIGRIDGEGLISQVKGHDYSVASLLGTEGHAFQGGHFAVLYLSPADYHRFHSPVAGTVTGYRYIKGCLVSVKPWLHNLVAGLLVSNERVISFLDSALGPVALVAVGATGVGRIRLSYSSFVSNLAGVPSSEETLREPLQVVAGDELGAFDLGSTIVLLLPDAGLRPLVQVGDKLRLGQALYERT
jgi:phosphatidylserine decarboxylase